jgi:predicted flap endonuclease-1-like 5' DNA nuclease
LKKINGIGPKMEEVLNSIGIYTFVQVSKMTKKEYDLLDKLQIHSQEEQNVMIGQDKQKN